MRKSIKYTVTLVTRFDLFSNYRLVLHHSSLPTNSNLLLPVRNS